MQPSANRTIVILGGATGIGAATAQYIARSGGNVVIGDINDAAANAVAERIRDAGGNVIALHANLGDLDSLRNLFDEASSRFGGRTRAADVAALSRDPAALPHLVSLTPPASLPSRTASACPARIRNPVGR
jgi:NAD(P)-dependent dehydrogenase (short-subunit alcohol dehydrogenase family)